MRIEMVVMNASVMYPVQVLREHLTGLEAAIVVCLADPDHKPVHKLRTETRRVEALLSLLSLMPELPEHRKEAATALRALAKLRRAAGKVRDLDVHRKMLESLTEAKTEDGAAGRVTEVQAVEETNSKKQSKTKARAGKAAPSEPVVDSKAPQKPGLSESAEELRKQLARDRAKAAEQLVEVLKKRQSKTAKAAESLLEKLSPAENLALPGVDLLRDAEALVTRDGLLRNRAITELDETELHTLRKSAKKARYLAETLPEDALLAGAARRFEVLQDAGGQWHDALEIAREARSYFGRGHELAAACRKERDQKLEAYRTALAAELKPEKEQAKSGRSGKKKEPVRAVKAARKAAKAA